MSRAQDDLFRYDKVWDKYDTVWSIRVHHVLFGLFQSDLDTFYVSIVAKRLERMYSFINWVEFNMRRYGLYIIVGLFFG